MFRFFSLLVSVPIIILVATFAYRNAQFVTIDFFTFKFDFPLAGVLLIVLLIGGCFGFILNFVLVLKQKATIRQLKKQKREMTSLSEALKTSDKRL